uniref:RNase_Zc3h12a domain-containing protein n=1 Tax=Strongyloides venezuelensis TaxID=75913 RepID=A0A0K0FU72_STRVS
MNNTPCVLKELYNKQVQRKLQRIVQNEYIFKPPCAEALPRIVVLDGCNIARGSCGPQREYFNCAGLLAAIRYFLIRDIDVMIFMPVIYLNNDNPFIADSHLLLELKKFDIITFTPARASHRGRPAFLNYDDLYVLHAAKRFGGVIVSNDRYADILKRQQYQQYHHIITHQRLDIQFIPVGKSIVKFGKDIFYKCLPNIEFSTTSQDTPVTINQRSLFCMPFDADYEKVAFRGRHWSKSRRLEIIRAIDTLLHNLESKCCIYDYTSHVATLSPLLNVQFANCFPTYDKTRRKGPINTLHINETLSNYSNLESNTEENYTLTPRELQIIAFKESFERFSEQLKKKNSNGKISTA